MAKINRRNETNNPYYLLVYSKLLYNNKLTNDMYLALRHSFDLQEKIPFTRSYHSYLQSLVLYKTKDGGQVK